MSLAIVIEPKFHQFLFHLKEKCLASSCLKFRGEQDALSPTTFGKKVNLNPFYCVFRMFPCPVS